MKNVEIEGYNENKQRFNGVYSRDNLLDKTDFGAYIVNLQDSLGPGTHWIALYLKNNKVIYFDSFGAEYIPKEVKDFIGIKQDIKTNIFRIQYYNSILWCYFCILFIDFMLKNKFTNLFSPYDFKKMMK